MTKILKSFRFTELDEGHGRRVTLFPFIKCVGKLTLSHNTLPSIMEYLKRLKHLKPHTVLVK